MKRRLEYVMTAEEYGELTNIIGSEIKDIGEIIHSEAKRSWSKAELLGRLMSIEANLKKADKILGNSQKENDHDNYNQK